MEETTNNSELSKRYNPHEDRYYTVAEVRKMNAAYQQRCRKRAKLKKLGAEVKKYLDEYKSKATGSEFRLAQLRFRDGMRLPYRWQDADLDKSVRILRKLKKELVAKLYGKGVPAPSKLAQKLMNIWDKSEDSLSDKLDAVQFLMEHVGKQLELVPLDQLPLTQSLITCALAYKLPDLPGESFAPEFKERLAQVLPQETYRLVMGGDDGKKLDAMAKMFADVSKDDAEIDEDDIIELGGIMDYL